jgi:DNA-binding transcriptional regulator YiaG
MNIDHPCVECGAKLGMASHIKRTRVGRYKVDDGSQLVPVCANGHAEIDLTALAEYERRAAVVVLSEAADVGGGEIRFARKALGLTQARLATLLDVAQETVSRWETGSETMSRVSRLALLAVVRDAGSLDRLAKNEPARIAEVLQVHAA